MTLLALGLLVGCGDVADEAVASKPSEGPEAWQGHLERSDEGLTAAELPAGGRAVDLRGRYQHAQVVRLEAGRASFVCADRVPAVEAALSREETGSSK